jgi:uncharacterized membrane protein
MYMFSWIIFSLVHRCVYLVRKYFVPVFVFGEPTVPWYTNWHIYADHMFFSTEMCVFG